GNGPLWQRMQVLDRSTTSARPRAASPRAGVSGSGMAAPATVYGRRLWAPAGQGSASNTAASHIPAIWFVDLTKNIHRDLLEPVFRSFRLARPHVARRIDGAGRPLDFGELPVPGLIDARQRERIARCARIVAGAGQPWRLRRFARQHIHDRGGARLALRMRSRCRFRNAAGERGITDDMNIGHELRGKARRIDRTPAGIVGGGGDLCTAARPLPRADASDTHGVI